MSDLSLIEHLKSRISELEQQTRELQYRLDQVTTLHSFEHETPDGPVLCWLDIPNKSTGQPELVCADLMSTRSFPGIKYFSRLPTFRNAPWKIAPPIRVAPAIPEGPSHLPPLKSARTGRPRKAPKARTVPPVRLVQEEPLPLSLRRRPGFNLDGTPRKRRRTGQ